VLDVRIQSPTKRETLDKRREEKNIEVAKKHRHRKRAPKATKNEDKSAAKRHWKGGREEEES